MTKAQKDKRKAILDAALVLFTERGFHGTATSTISKEAGIATGTLFNYFPSKEELVTALYRDIKQEVRSFLITSFEQNNTAKAVLKQVWFDYVKWGLKNPMKIHFMDQFGTSPYVTQMTEDETKEFFKLFVDVIQTGVEQGAISEHPMELIVRAMECGLKALITLLQSSHETEEDEEDLLIERSFSLLWEGLAPR